MKKLLIIFFTLFIPTPIYASINFIDNNTYHLLETTQNNCMENMHYSIIDYNNVCANSSISSVMMIIGYMLEIVKWLVPLIIIILGMIDFGKAVISSNEDAIKGSTSIFIRRIIAGISIFFIITIVDVFSDILLETDIKTGKFASCTECMLDPMECSSNIALMKEEEAKIYKEYLKDRKECLEQQKPEEPPANDMPPVGTITYIDTSELGCTVYYEPSKGTLMTRLGFDSSQVENMRSALKNTCGFINNYSFIDYLQTAGSYVARDGGEHDYHRVGLAIDLNNLFVYTHPTTNKSYRPYSSQGVSTWNNYKTFICEVCNGKEDCVYNINYQIFERYFKPYGWCWGGNWSPEWFDPMHFEKRTGGCSVANRQPITCS